MDKLKNQNDNNSQTAFSGAPKKLSRSERRGLLKLYKNDKVDEAYLFERGIQHTDFDYVYAMSSKSGLSFGESVYNALYINSLHRFYNSNKKVSDELRNTFEHPKGWYGDSFKTWKGNFWSGVFGFIQRVPIVRVSVESFVSALPKKLRKRYRRGTERMDNSFKLVEGMGRFFKRCAVAIVGLVIIVPIVIHLYGKVTEDVALEVFVNGASVGVTNSYDEITTIKKNVEAFISESIGESFWFNDEITYKLVKKKNHKVLDEKELQQTMISLAKYNYIVPGYTLFVDGTAVAKSDDRAVLDTARRELIEKFEENAKGKEKQQGIVSYANEIVITDTDIHIDSIQHETEIRKLLGLKPKTSYENLPKDPLYTLYYDTILKNVQMSKVEDATMVISGITSLEPSEAGDLLSGTQNTNEVKLGYLIIKNETVEEAVPYTIKYIESDKYIEGTQKIETLGKNGLRNATYAVSYKDGVEVGRKLVEEEILKPAEARIIYKGTRIPTEEELETIATGTFIIPYDNYLSSSYGIRNVKEFGTREFHNAWDIPGPYGSDILASDGGVVSQVAYSSGYGRHVIIDHENGYETVYAHLSKAVVNVGDRVGQGDVIGKMGSTGRVTGVHVHFEIRKDGVSVDPEEFIGYVEEKY